MRRITWMCYAYRLKTTISKRPRRENTNNNNNNKKVYRRVKTQANVLDGRGKKMSTEMFLRYELYTRETDVIDVNIFSF